MGPVAFVIDARHPRAARGSVGWQRQGLDGEFLVGRQDAFVVAQRFSPALRAYRSSILLALAAKSASRKKIQDWYCHQTLPTGHTASNHEEAPDSAAGLYLCSP